jgi:hypothetical protein
MAMDLTGRYLYVSNMTMSGAMNHLQILDVKTGNVVKTLTFDDVTLPDPDGLTPALPAGLFIR